MLSIRICKGKILNPILWTSFGQMLSLTIKTTN